ncbi:hypothetical protein LJC52_01780 [Bacteroidales bacterium OttesenSCG-928-A17]|nr:hypothetical protein [Bacteroidales bacterium OttesenSCG-928-A17]
MKRRVISKPFFQGSYLALFLSLFRTEFICVMANSKLYFLLQLSVSAAKNACPTRGKTPSEVGCFWESFRAMIEWQSDTARRILPLKNPTYE